MSVRDASRFDRGQCETLEATSVHAICFLDVFARLAGRKTTVGRRRIAGCRVFSRFRRGIQLDSSTEREIDLAHLNRRGICTAIFATLLVSGASAQTREPAEILVYAASSLTDVLDELSRAYEKESGTRVRISFAASSVLARQIEAGTRADVFCSADQQWMDYLDARGLLAAGTRRDVVGNRLVLIAPADSRLSLEIEPGFGLAAALGRRRLSTGDPDAVPVGRYAREALTNLGVWKDVEAKIVRADNVRTALMYVSRGEVPLGIVYATDAAVDPGVRVVATFPADSHRSITYPAAATLKAQPAAKDYLDFLSGERAATTWRKFGFATMRD